MTGVLEVSVRRPPGAVAEQVEVVTTPAAFTLRHPEAPPRAVIAKLVVVAFPLIVVEARDARPLD